MAGHLVLRDCQLCNISTEQVYFLQTTVGHDEPTKGWNLVPRAEWQFFFGQLTEHGIETKLRCFYAFPRGEARAYC